MELCNCTALTENFHLLSTSLLYYLDSLNYCNCEALATECEEKTYNIAGYFSLAYDKICNPGAYNSTCYTNSTLTRDTERYCKQIDDYRRGETYDDWFIGWSPFCRMYAYGASQKSYDLNPYIFSPYNNMSIGCQGASVFALAVLYLLCILIIIANVTVLLVVRLDPYFHSPYGYFKASIALADLLVGIVVVPNIIYLFQEETFQPKIFRQLGEFPALENLSGPFFDVAGFFTILTISVSGYTLAASSMDRYYSITHPFKYQAKKFFTRRRSMAVILLIWVLSTIYGLFPFMSSAVGYFRVSATFILAGEKPPVRSNQITFNWTKVFNLTSPNDTDDVTFNVTPTIMQISNNITYFTNTTTMTPKLDESRSKIEDNDFDLTTEIFQDSNSTVDGTSLSNTSGSAIYLILSLYLLFLFIPLIVVWIVNICTIRSYSRRQETSKDSITSLQGSIRSNTEAENPSLNPLSGPPSASTSLTSIHVAANNEAKHQNGTQTGPNENSNDATPENNFLSVPQTTVPPQHRRSFRSKKVTRTVSTNSDTPRSPLTRLKSLSFTLRRTKPSKKESAVARRMQKILLRMVISFTVCTLPAILVLVLHIFFESYTNPYRIENYSVDIKFWKVSFSYLCSIFLFGNSFVNCIIYTVLGKRFREVAKKIYSGKIKTIKSSLKKLPAIIYPSFSKSTSPKKTNPNIVEETIP